MLRGWLENAKMRMRDEPASSGYTSLSYGIVGSMNGWGVWVSTKMGRLIATLLPRRRRMLAVSVLRRLLVRHEIKRSGVNVRESNMWVGYLVWQKQAVAGFCI